MSNSPNPTHTQRKKEEARVTKLCAQKEEIFRSKKSNRANPDEYNRHKKLSSLSRKLRTTVTISTSLCKEVRLNLFSSMLFEDYSEGLVGIDIQASSSFYTAHIYHLLAPPLQDSEHQRPNCFSSLHQP